MLIVNRTGVIAITLATGTDKELFIGSLLREKSGTVKFSIDESYVRLGPDRPLVSLSWKGRTEEDSVLRLRAGGDKVMYGGSLPPFFQNLLPEGALRELVEKEFGAGSFDSFDVLARLGQDLPGALIARQEAGQMPPIARYDPQDATESGGGPPIRFSLAGVQLKFSMAHRGSLTVPAIHGQGRFILKTPSPDYRLLPEAEWTAMHLAKLAGVRVAEARLLESDKIEGVPKRYLQGSAFSLAVERFDRKSDGSRVQAEDFAQIMGAVGDQKYTKANETTVMNIVQRLSTDSRGELLESVRRIVVNLLLGNGDAHLKNWSFLYPSGGEIALTPAYDIVPTFLYGDDRMALEFGGTKDPSLINMKRFERAAGLLRVEPKVLTREAKHTVETALDVWPSFIKDAPLSSDMRAQLIKRLNSLPIVREVLHKQSSS